MKHCQNCGEMLPESMKFCPNCGFKQPEEKAGDPDSTNDRIGEKSSEDSQYTEAEFVLEDEETDVFDEEDHAEMSEPNASEPKVNEPVRDSKSSKMAVLAFIFSLTLVLSGIGIILAIIDLIKNKEDGKKHGLSVAALAIGGTIALLSTIGRLFVMSKQMAEKEPVQTATISQSGLNLPLQTFAFAQPDAAVPQTEQPKQTPEPVELELGTIHLESDRRIVSIELLPTVLVGIREDGTVASSGLLEGKEIDTSTWTRVTQLSAADGYLMGLREDGTVLATGKIPSEVLQKIRAWKDIATVRAGTSYAYGLRKNGRVSVVSMIGSAGDYHVKQVEGWTDIYDLRANNSRIFGHRKDGTWVADSDSNLKSISYAKNPEEIADIFFLGTKPIILKANGDVEQYEMDPKIPFIIPKWHGIKKMVVEPSCVYGLKRDGTVVTAGREEDWNRWCFAEVSSWTDLVDFDYCGFTAAGLKADGTVVYTGVNEIFTQEEWNR